MEVKLIVASGKLTGKSIPIKPGKFLIGRGEECQLRPQSTMVSRRHCLITVDESTVTIEDLGSTNGTYLNDVKLEGRRELHNGDRLRVGMLGFEVAMDVGLGGKSKPKVHGVQEAAARAAAAAASSGKEDVDISNWLIEDSKIIAMPPDAGRGVSEDTMTGKSLVDTATIATPPPPHTPEQKPEPAEKTGHSHSKIIGKMQRPSKPKTADSGSAAADALRQFFHRKKP
jgi:predicted component of type VI protein secretion system